MTLAPSNSEMTASAALAVGPTPPNADTSPKRKRRRSPEMPITFTLVTAVLTYAWLRRNEGDLTAETGVGYYLGIAGTLAMLTLLLYPLRKRFVGLRFIGNVKGWFRTHMILGIVGPVLIILHSNFMLGSINSALALWAMLVVAISGVIGRFFYARIHRGLYGRRAHLREYIADVETFKAAFDEDMPDPAWLLELLAEYEAQRMGRTHSLWVNLGRVLLGPYTRYQERRLVMRQVKEKLSEQGARSRYNIRQFQRHLKSYLRGVAKVQSFALYERLFALWHVFHLPLFVILVFAAIIHVVGVHLY